MIIIAEIGINHNGNIHLAYELIKQAKVCGADIAKFQFYDPHKIFGKDGSHPDPENLEIALRLQFAYEDACRLKELCDRVEIEFMASVFDMERLEWIRSFGVNRYKVASRSVQDGELCESMIKEGKETFVSLGFWNEDGVPFTEDNVRYLYCVPKYPCDYSDILLPGSFNESKYDGLSDHTMGIETALIAAARGAAIIEKHFTLSKGFDGPDHTCSMTPDELRVLSQYARQIETALKDFRSVA